MVVAIDDAVGLVLFSASFGIANALEQGRIDPISILLEPLVEIVLSLGLARWPVCCSTSWRSTSTPAPSA